MTVIVQIPLSLGGTNVPYNDGTGPYGMFSGTGGYGVRTYFMPMVSEVIAACSVAVTAASSATNAANVNGTSSSSVTVGTASGTATFVMNEANRAIAKGMHLVFANTADPTNYIFGPAQSWDAGTKTVVINKEKVNGSGTFSAWTVSLSGPMPPTSGETTSSLGALINGATSKTTPVDADMLGLMDSAASNVLKKLSWANLKTTIWAALGAGIASVTTKTTPVGGDEVAIADSAASSATKRLSLTNLAAFLASLTQTLTNKTLTSPTITGGTADTFSIGYKEIPQNSKSAAYTTVLSDSGKHIFHPSADTTARVWTIDSNANVAYPIGTAITFINQNGAGVITIAITSDTMRLAGAGTTGSRTLAANGIATAIKVASTEWIISGTGLT